MNTIEALQGLYKKLGGDAEDVAELTTIPEMVGAITSQVDAGGGGSDLPAVTSADNGKVLSVVDGIWDTNEPFVVTYTSLDSWDDGKFYCSFDQHLDDILNAKFLGREIKVLLDTGNGDPPLEISINAIVNDDGYHILSGVAAQGDFVFILTHIDDDEEIAYFKEINTSIFDVVNGLDDNGKTMRVVGGALCLSAPFVATYTPTSATTATCDKTFAEIKEMLELGYDVVGVASMTEGTATVTVQLRYDGYGVDGDDGHLYFSGTIYDKLITVAHRYISGVESVEFAQYTLS